MLFNWTYLSLLWRGSVVFFSVLKKELETTLKNALLPLSDLEELYKIKGPASLDTKAAAIARALGVEGDEELINVIKKALQGKKG